jgi:hypothetical protein
VVTFQLVPPNSGASTVCAASDARVVLGSAGEVVGSDTCVVGSVVEESVPEPPQADASSTKAIVRREKRPIPET